MLTDFLFRLRALFRRGAVEEELDEELRFHFDHQVEKFVRSGVPIAEARRLARLSIGGLDQVKEQCREARGVHLIETFAQDIRYGLRMLRKSPSFTVISSLTLALGIGASTTVFSWIHAVLLNPLPGVAEPDRVVMLETLTPDGDWKHTSYLDFRDLRRVCELVESMSVAKPLDLAVGDDDTTARVWGEAVSGNYFDLLRVSPELGRFFSTDEVDHEQNAHPLVIISHSYWSSHYDRDPHALGTILRINHFPYTIIGVAPEAFHGSMPGVTFDLWTPSTMFGQLTSTGNSALLDRKWRTFRVLARLGPGVGIEQARAEVQSHAEGMARANAHTNEGMSATLLPMWRSHDGVQDSLLAPLTILIAACAVVVLAVCANLLNLLLARFSSRQREFGMRLALGAARSRLIRQVLTESSLLVAVGSLAGIATAYCLRGSLGWLVANSSMPTLVIAPIDAMVLLFAIALSLVVALLAGITPALHAVNGNVNETLKEGGRMVSTGRMSRLRRLFVTSEVALALVVLIGAGLFLRSFQRVSEIRPGFDSDHVAVAQVGLAAASFDASQADSFCQRLRERLERQPGITGVSYADYVPLSVSAGSWEDLQVQGYVPQVSENMKIYRSLVSPGYFELMRIPILEGRDFDMSDEMKATPVMIVNEEFVRRFMSDRTAVGSKVRGWGKWFTIVGVVQDSKIYRLTEASTPYFYVPIRQIYRPEMGLIFYARTSGSIPDAITAMRREARGADSAVPVFDAMSLNDSVAASLFPQRISASLLSVLGSVTLLLAAVGVYGVVGYSVAQRTNEIGIRMAFGAQRNNVLLMVLREGAGLAVLGIIIGGATALGVMRFVMSFLYGVDATDPFTFVAVSVLLLAVALLASFIPAYRAMRVDPLIALRHE